MKTQSGNILFCRSNFVGFLYIALINPFMPIGLLHFNSLDRSISKRRDVRLAFIITTL